MGPAHRARQGDQPSPILFGLLVELRETDAALRGGFEFRKRRGLENCQQMIEGIVLPNPDSGAGCR